MLAGGTDLSLIHFSCSMAGSWRAAVLSATAFIYGSLSPAVRTSLLADGHEQKMCKYSFNRWRPAAVISTAGSVMHISGAVIRERRTGVHIKMNKPAVELKSLDEKSFILQLWQSFTSLIFITEM